MKATGGTRPFAIDWLDAKKVLIHAAEFAGATFVVAILTYLRGVDFGAYAPVASVVLSTLIDLARKFLSDSR